MFQAVAGFLPWGSIWGFFKKNFIPILLGMLLIYTHYKMYSWGAENVREEFAEARAEQLEREVKLKAKEAEANRKKGEQVTARVVQREADLANKREEINEHLQKASDCPLTADDIELLNSLGDKVRPD